MSKGDQTRSNVVSIFTKLNAKPSQSQPQATAGPLNSQGHSQGLRSHVVIQSQDKNSKGIHSKSIPTKTSEHFGKRFALPESVSPQRNRSSAALVSLRENFNTLTHLQSRLRFMINELEGLIKK